MGWQDWQAPGFGSGRECRLPAPYQHYVLKERAGVEALGVVYDVRDVRPPGRRVAIKFVDHPQWKDRPEWREAFHAEASLSRGVGSHHLAHSYDVLDLSAHVPDGWRPDALVMEYLEPSLKDLLDEYKTSRRFLLLIWVERWLRQLADGMNELHQRHGLVHRDLKPGNILFRYVADGGLDGAEAVIGDFGTVGRIGGVPLFELGQDADGWKDPALYDPATGEWKTDRAAHPSEDVYSFGRIIQAIRPVTEHWPDYLSELSADCPILTRPGASPRKAFIAGWSRRAGAITSTCWKKRAGGGRITPTSSAGSSSSLPSRTSSLAARAPEACS